MNTLAETSPTLMLIWIGLTGLFVGSFLNVCIARYPYEEETVSRPRRSRCPNCKRTLTWRENIPLLSWLWQRGRCANKECRWRIPVRYPLVELMTAGLWLMAAWYTGFDHYALLGIQVLTLSALVVATFVDFDCFEIPDQISIGGMILAPVFSFAVPALHADTWLAQYFSAGDAGSVDRFGALMASLAGLAVGGGVLWLIGWVGSRIYGREAMGFGDVKLLAAAGGLIGPGGALAALLIASAFASVAGVGNIARFYCVLRSRDRVRGRARGIGGRMSMARLLGRYLPFGPYLAIGIGIVLLAWNDIPWPRA